MIPEHLPLADRKGLAIKLLGFHAVLEDSIYGGQSIDDDDALSAFDLDRVILDDATHSPDSCHLDEYVQLECVGILDHKLSRPPLALRESALARGRRFLDTFRRLAARLSCDRCSAMRDGPICSGDPAHDHEAVHRGGTCLIDIPDLFRQADAVVRDLYKRWIPADCPAEQATPLLSTERSSTDVPLKSATSFDEGGFQAKVKLRLCPESLSLENYLEVLYALVHELTAHAYNGIARWPAPRSPARPDSPFAEGWMDYVALLLFDLWLDADTEFDVPEHAVWRREAGDACSRRRGEVDRPPPGIGRRGGPQACAHAVRNGRIAAHFMRCAFRTAGGAERGFLQLSSAWNSQPRMALESDDLVLACLKLGHCDAARLVAHAKEFLDGTPPEKVWDDVVESLHFK
jgi:hypothetical protein